MTTPIVRPEEIHERFRQAGPAPETPAEQSDAAPIGYPLTYFDDLSAQTVGKRWLIKGIFARGETSAWIAPPGGMKSALMAQASICVAGAMDWHGLKNKGRAGVVYFALERADLVKRRLRAHRERLQLGSLPIAVAQATINLMSPTTVPAVLVTIREAEQKFGCGVGLVIFDTFAKLIAAGGGDEDKARDQGATFANIQRVKDGADIHVAIVGHTGKNEERGARGSNAILGDADVMVSIAGDFVRTANVTKANDGPEGALFSFKSEIHDFGVDEDGDPISVNIVSDEAVPVEQSSIQPKTLPPSTITALRALAEALDDRGINPPVSPQIPPGVRRVVTIENWREYAYRKGISDGGDRAQQKAFKKAFDGLISTCRVGVWEGQVWLPS